MLRIESTIDTVTIYIKNKNGFLEDIKQKDTMLAIDIINPVLQELKIRDLR